jgi:hypothetical protein
MNKVAKPRFSSAEAALRFFFRARELLGATANGAFQIPRKSPAWLPASQGIFKDYIAVASSLCHLDEFQIWLMCELYGPTCFSARQRTLTSALRTAHGRFPCRQITRCEIGRVRRSTIQMLRCRLAVNGLVPAAGGAPARPVIATGNHASAPNGRASMGH